MPSYKQSYDNATKANLLPVGTEIQKALVLQIDPKNEEKAIFIGGLAYCVVVDGQHWVIGCNESMFFTHTNMFFMKKKADGSGWEKQPNEEKAWRTAYEANGCCYAVNLDGHGGGEALVKALDGKFIDSDFTILTDDGDKVTATIKAILEADGEDVDTEGVLSSTFLVYDHIEVSSQKDRKGKAIPYPLLGEDNKPLVLPLLPKIKTGKSGWGAGKAGFLSSSDRLKEALAFKDNAEFENLFNWYQAEPIKVAFALSLTGVSITVNAPTVTSGCSSNKVAKVTIPTEVPKEVSKHNPTDVLVNFGLVYEKEKGTGDSALAFSNEAIEAIDNPDTVDSYKEALFALSDFTVNGKSFPFGVTKNKMNITGSVFKLSLEELTALVATLA